MSDDINLVRCGRRELTRSAPELVRQSPDLMTVQLGPRDVIAVGIATSRLSILNPSTQATLDLIGEVFEKQGVHRAEGDMRCGGMTGCAAAVRCAVIAVGIGVLAAAAVGARASPAAAQASQHGSANPQVLADQAIRRLDLQTELLHGPEPWGFTLRLPPEVLWLAVIVGLGVLLYTFRDMLPSLRVGGRGWAGGEDSTIATGGRAPEYALGAADELAAAGRFVEAMHVLLLQALAEIRGRLDEQFADSMTSREILRSKALSDELRRSLREVVDRVEWSYFGDHPAGPEDYVACRGSFGALAQALHRTAAA